MWFSYWCRFPLTTTTFEWDELPSFFENLASEGWLRKALCEQSDIAYEDTLGLLLANGMELVGALSIIPNLPDKESTKASHLEA